LVEALSGSVEPGLATIGQSLAALPQAQRFLERQIAGLETFDGHDELFARLLVAERADVGLILLRGRFGHRCLLRSDGGTCEQVGDPLRGADPVVSGLVSVNASTRASAPGLGIIGSRAIGPRTSVPRTAGCRVVGFGRGRGD